MITPNQSGSLTIPASTYDALWISNLNVLAPSLTGSIKAFVNLIPYNSSTGEMYPSGQKTLRIPDIYSASLSTPDIGMAMQNIFSAVQELVVSQSLFN